MNVALLEMRSISKAFPGVQALKNVSFSVQAGEIHGLVGENGAGKSTLMKILSGVYPHGSFEGQILLEGQPQIFRGIADSRRAGIAIIPQELAMVPEMSVYENLLLGEEITRGVVVDVEHSLAEARRALDLVRLAVDPEMPVKHLGVGQQQLLEIARALRRNSRLLILDEPTAALNEVDSDNLLYLLIRLRSQGLTSILISHKLREVQRVADTVTVLRDGASVATLSRREGEIPIPTLIRHMVGREIDEIYPARHSKPSTRRMLEVRGLCGVDPRLQRTVFRDVSFHVHAGEVVGLAGLAGAGRTEIARTLYGNANRYRVSGQVLIEGRPLPLVHPQIALRHGLAYATEDRKRDGLVLIQPVRQNVSLARLDKVSRGGIVNSVQETQVAENYRRELNIKTPSVEQLARNLSGGNQQKVCLARWLFAEPRVLILDEPTRGIDVGAKLEIYSLINRLVEQGLAILLISSELLEILGLCDRIYVVSAGRITGHLNREEATQEKILELATQ